MSDAVRVSGLREYIDSVDQLGAVLPTVAQRAANEITESIVSAGVPRIPRDDGSAARSVKTEESAGLLRIVAGGSSAPQYGWLEFGGRVGRNHAVVRPAAPRGRYVFAAFYEQQSRGKFEATMTTQLVSAARAAGLEVS